MGWGVPCEWTKGGVGSHSQDTLQLSSALHCVRIQRLISQNTTLILFVWRGLSEATHQLEGLLNNIFNINTVPW